LFADEFDDDVFCILFCAFRLVLFKKDCLISFSGDRDEVEDEDEDDEADDDDLGGRIGPDDVEDDEADDDEDTAAEPSPL
jgi:hypothetical protein